MPTTLSTPSNAVASMRWAEPYTSDGLNRKLNGLMPRGVIRGGRLVTAGSALLVTVEADPDTGDSVYSYVNAQGRQVTVRQEGNVTLNLSASASSTVYVALYVSYTIGSETEVEWRSYTEAELFGGSPVAEHADVIIVGRVVVPGSGPIAATSVSFGARRYAWDAHGRSALPWSQVVVNPSFELGPGEVTPGVGFPISETLGWRGPNSLSDINDTTFRVVSDPGGARSGDQYLEIDATGASGVVDAEIYQEGWFSVVPGQAVRLGLSVSSDSWDDTAVVNAEATVVFYDLDFAPIGNIVLGFADVSGTMSWEDRSTGTTVPAGARYGRLAIFLDTGASTPGGQLRLDDVTVHLEPVSSYALDEGERAPLGAIAAQRISMLVEAGDDGAGTGAATFSTRRVEIRNDQTVGGLYITRGSRFSPGSLVIQAREGTIQAADYQYDQDSALSPYLREMEVNLANAARGHDTVEWELSLVAATTGPPFWLNNGSVTLPIWFPLCLPSGAVLTQVDVGLKPNVARATGVHRMVCRVLRSRFDWATPGNAFTLTQVASATDDGSNNHQVVSMASLGHTVVDGNSYYVSIVGGNTTSPGGDAVFSVRYFFEDPGPRNYGSR